MAQKGFDVAIVDVKLPDVSGIDLIQPLRVASPFSEVLLLTGFASVDAAIGAPLGRVRVLLIVRPRADLDSAQALGKFSEARREDWRSAMRISSRSRRPVFALAPREVA